MDEEAISPRGNELAPVSEEALQSAVAHAHLGTVQQASSNQQVVEPTHQCNIAGGEYFGASFGPQTYNLTRQEGIIDGNFQGAHFGTQNVQQNIQNYYITRSVSEEVQSTRESFPERQPQSLPSTPSGNPPGRERVQLSDAIWMFRDMKLSEWGNVYEGEMTSGVYGPQPIAVKFIELNKRNVEEAKSLLKLKPHKHVVSLIHSDVCDQGPLRFMFIAMERCHPQNLYDHIMTTRDVPFDSTQRLTWSGQLIQGMQHIHENKIIHRDLKPHNLLLSVDKNDIKIADFGLSKEMKSGRSITNQSTSRVGTDGYRAPETYNSDVISQQADIFSLGLVMHFMWSDGKHPFGEDPDLWNHNIKRNKDRYLGQLLIPNADVAVNLLEQMLQFEPKDRPTIDLIINSISNVTGCVVPSPVMSPTAGAESDFSGDFSLSSVSDIGDSRRDEEQLHGANGNARVGWDGTINWTEKRDAASTSAWTELHHTFQCKALLASDQDDGWISTHLWPPALEMSLFPHAVFRSLSRGMRHAPRVKLQISPPDQMRLLSNVMAKKWFGLVQIKSASLNVIMLVIHHQGSGRFFGLFPLDPDNFVTSLVASQRH